MHNPAALGTMFIGLQKKEFPWPIPNILPVF